MENKPKIGSLWESKELGIPTNNLLLVTGEKTFMLFSYKYPSGEFRYFKVFEEFSQEWLQKWYTECK